MANDDDDDSKLKYHKSGLKLSKDSEELIQESQRIEKVKTDFNRVKLRNIVSEFFSVYSICMTVPSVYKVQIVLISYVAVNLAVEGSVALSI